jgi:hypothetical protein
MRNRTLFADMVNAHWAVKHPKTSTARMIEHDQYTAVLRAEQFAKHARSLATPNLPAYEDGVRERLDKRYRNGSASWTGKSTPKMVRGVETMWSVGDRASDRYRRPRGHLLHGCRQFTADDTVIAATY